MIMKNIFVDLLYIYTVATTRWEIGQRYTTINSGNDLRLKKNVSDLS
jgi:hypothetical protein